MTVRDLRQKIVDLPDDAVVCVGDGDGMFYEATFGMSVAAPRWTDRYGVTRYEGLVFALSHMREKRE